MIFYIFRNHLANICCHFKDFILKVVSMNYFATSHGKTNNDGLGAIVKRFAMRFCLRAGPNKQITTALEMYEYLSKQLKSVR